MRVSGDLKPAPPPAAGLEWGARWEGLGFKVNGDELAGGLQLNLPSFAE
jgi:hypothetical protein